MKVRQIFVTEELQQCNTYGKQELAQTTCKLFQKGSPGGKTVVPSKSPLIPAFLHLSK